jgi:hypothetical protein
LDCTHAICFFIKALWALVLRVADEEVAVDAIAELNALYDREKVPGDIGG